MRFILICFVLYLLLSRPHLKRRKTPILSDSGAEPGTAARHEKRPQKRRFFKREKEKRKTEKERKNQRKKKIKKRIRKREKILNKYNIII